MLVCHCEAIRDRTIAKAIRHGARTIEDVQVACGASARCGGCEDTILDMLAEHAVRETPVLVAPRSAFG
jgi:bacterioferritin-associated ferredoxin